VRGDNLGSITAALLRLLDDYGSQELEAAITESLRREVPHPNGVRLTLERRRAERDQPPPIGICIDDQRAQKLVVRTHDLQGYDQLQTPQDKDPEEVEEDNDDDTQN
jgi:hypothetical protein